MDAKACEVGFDEWIKATFDCTEEEDGTVGVGGTSFEYVDLKNTDALKRFSSPSSVDPKRLIIFSDEWERRGQQWKSAISAGLGVFVRRIGARECEVRPVERQAGKLFLDQNHVQGSNRLSVVYLGLYFHDELEGLASLGRHNRHTTFNLILLDRLCFRSGVQIVGGASKLLKACADWARGMKYDEIVSFSDNRWSDGGVYTSLGMEMDVNLRPDYFYVKDGKILTKQGQKKSATGCPSGMTEFEWASVRGLSRVYDYGKKRWSLNLWPGSHENRKEIRARRCAERQRDGDFNNSHIRGFFKSKKTGDSIYYASSYELRCLYLLDLDVSVKSFRRCDAFKAEERWRNPDLWVEFSDGRIEIWEVKPKTVLELEEVKSQIADSVKFAASSQAGFRLWTEDQSGLSGQTEIIRWAREYIAKTTGDVSVLERVKENNRRKVKRYRERLSSDRAEVWCEHCSETHNIRRIAYDRNVGKHGRYVCKSEACEASGKSPKIALRRVNQHASEGKKECSACHRVLLIEEFSVKNVSWDGRVAQCKECVSTKKKTAYSAKKLLKAPSLLPPLS